MRGKPIAVNSGLTVRHDIKPGSGEDSLVFSGSGLSGPLYLGTSSLHTIFQHMGREAVLRLLGEPELPVGRPPAPGWNRLPPTIEQVEALHDRLQRAEGLLGQALGRIEGLERHIARELPQIRNLEHLVFTAPDSVLHRLQKVKDALLNAFERIERLEHLQESGRDHVIPVLERLEELEGNDTATAHRLQVTVEHLDKLERLVVHLSPKDILRRLSALEAQAKTCADGECECYQAGHEATRAGE